MTSRHVKRSAPTAELDAKRSPLVRWLARCVAPLRAPRAPALPPLRVPTRPRLRVPRPGGLSSLLAARLAVRAGITLQVFLQHRLARSLAALPVPATRLPVTIAIEGSALVTRAAAPAPARRAPWLEAFLRAEGPAALSPEIELSHAEVAWLGSRIEAQRQRADAARRELEDASRTDIADPADEAQASTMGRPPVPPPLGLVLRVMAVTLLLAEAWNLAVPCLRAAGFPARDLLAGLRHDPLSLGPYVALGLGAATSLVLCADLALRRARVLLQAPPVRWVAALLVALGAAALALGLAGSLGVMHFGPDRLIDVACSRVVLLLAGLALPFAVAWMFQLASVFEADRVRALAEVRAWEAQHYRALAQVSRRVAALREEERLVSQLELQRAAAAQRLRALQHRARMVERLAADVAEEDEADLSCIAQSITAALERDRYDYLRHAARVAPAGRGEDPRPSTPVRPAAAAGVGEQLGLTG